MTGRRRAPEPRWNWLRRRRNDERPEPPEVTAARRERERAEARLAQTRNMVDQAASTMRQLREINQRNHFADMVNAALKGRR